MQILKNYYHSKMRTIFFIGLFIVWSLKVAAQSSSIPNVILDSLIFETKLGRSCSEVMKAQAIELEKQGIELVHTNTALKLSQSSNQTLSDLLNNSKESNSIQALQFQKDLSDQKRKTKRWRKVAVIQTLGIVGLIILML